MNGVTVTERYDVALKMYEKKKQQKILETNNMCKKRSTCKVIHSLHFANVAVLPAREIM